MKVAQVLKNLWVKLNTPSDYAVWSAAFESLQQEEKRNGMSPEYWRIWHEEVCPAYKKLSGTDDEILHDMDLPISERKYF